MKIIVLMGGDPSEREVSLVTGDQVAKALIENGHEVIKIDPAATKKEQTELNQTDQHWIDIEYPDIEMLPLHRGSLTTIGKTISFNFSFESSLEVNTISCATGRLNFRKNNLLKSFCMASVLDILPEPV